jgi:hypothetical protein
VALSKQQINLCSASELSFVTDTVARNDALPIHSLSNGLNEVLVKDTLNLPDNKIASPHCCLSQNSKILTEQAELSA